MNTTTTILARPVQLGTADCSGEFSDDWIKRARLWFARQKLDTRARYFADATDLVDLEHREREWEQYERRCSMFSRLL